MEEGNVGEQGGEAEAEAEAGREERDEDDLMFRREYEDMLVMMKLTLPLECVQSGLSICSGTSLTRRTALRGLTRGAL